MILLSTLKILLAIVSGLIGVGILVSGLCALIDPSKIYKEKLFLLQVRAKRKEIFLQAYRSLRGCWTACKLELYTALIFVISISCFILSYSIVYDFYFLILISWIIALILSLYLKKYILFKSNVLAHLQNRYTKPNLMHRTFTPTTKLDLKQGGFVKCSQLLALFLI
jgi:hypothetical protein